MTSRPRIWSIGSVVIILLLAYAGWMLLLRPAFAHVATTRQEVVSTWTQVDRARAKTQDLARQKEDLQSQVDELLRLRAKIPKDVNVPTLMRTIQADAKPRSTNGLSDLSGSPLGLRLRGVVAW